MMISTVSTVLVDTLFDFHKTERKKWVIKWPSQTVITSDQILWTSWVVDAISKFYNFLKLLCYLINKYYF